MSLPLSHRYRRPRRRNCDIYDDGILQTMDRPARIVAEVAVDEVAGAICWPMIAVWLQLAGGISLRRLWSERASCSRRSSALGRSTSRGSGSNPSSGVSPSGVLRVEIFGGVSPAHRKSADCCVRLGPCPLLPIGAWRAVGEDLRGRRSCTKLGGASAARATSMTRRHTGLPAGPPRAARSGTTVLCLRPPSRSPTRYALKWVFELSCSRRLLRPVRH
jgi:hypothetical protein